MLATSLAAGCYLFINLADVLQTLGTACGVWLGTLMLTSTSCGHIAGIGMPGMNSFHRGDWLQLAQAGGGMLAIAAAALVPFVHGLFLERRRRRAQMRIVLAVCARMSRRLDDLKTAFESRDILPGYMDYGADREWDQTRQTLAAFPVWDLTDHAIAVHIGHLRSAAEHGHGIAKRYAAGRDAHAPTYEALVERVLACKVVVSRAEIELRARL